ncbi:MAG: hypothetical protein QOI07_2607 [Verrucomicrobiota bacterium]|jgi:hypothetical protein
MIPLEESIQSIVASCPTAGEGVNRWFYLAALRLLRLGLDKLKVEELLEEGSVECGRAIRPDEIPRAVRNAAAALTGARPLSHCKWPARNYEQIEAVASAGLSTNDLEESSPLRPDAGSTEAIVDALFPRNPLICAGRTLTGAVTKHRADWRGSLARQQFIVPSPMSKPTGITLEGKTSARSLDNTGPRRFLVVEFDFAEHDDSGHDTDAAPVLRRLAEQGRTISDLCASLHAHLADFRPLALVVHSGRRSAHGWYPVRDEDEDVMLRFMRFAVSLGADPATWTRAQFVRMPDGLRNNGNRQRVLYYNPAVIGGAE